MTSLNNITVGRLSRNDRLLLRNAFQRIINEVLEQYNPTLRRQVLFRFTEVAQSMLLDFQETPPPDEGNLEHGNEEGNDV